jgi:hypothetical protein
MTSPLPIQLEAQLSDCAGEIPSLRRPVASGSTDDFDRTKQKVFGGNWVAMGFEALQVGGYRFLGVGERFRLGGPLSVATLKGGDEGVKATFVFRLENDRESMSRHPREFYSRKPVSPLVGRDALDRVLDRPLVTGVYAGVKSA